MSWQLPVKSHLTYLYTQGRVCLVIMILTVICQQQNKFQVFSWKTIWVGVKFSTQALIIKVHPWHTFPLRTGITFLEWFTKIDFIQKKPLQGPSWKIWSCIFFKPVRRGILAYKYTAQRDKAGNKPKTVYVLSTYNQANFVSIGKWIKREML